MCAEHLRPYAVSGERLISHFLSGVTGFGCCLVPTSAHFFFAYFNTSFPKAAFIPGDTFAVTHDYYSFMFPRKAS